MKRLLLAAAVVVALIVPASPASAELTGEYARFSKCPLSNQIIDLCLYSKSTSGSFTIGKKTVPLVNPVVLQGGIDAPEFLGGPLSFFAASDGNTIPKVAQPVPGGLLGITAPSWWPQVLKDLFNETINNGFTGVSATVELAAPASSIKVSVINALTGNGSAFVLPIKVKLSNPFLGNNCYIGSNSNPITLNLTTGTTAPPPPNQPISGSPGKNAEPAFAVVAVENNRLVDNSFSAPGASGCGGILFSWAVDPLVDSILGTPSPSGTNTAILEGTTWLAGAEALREL